MRGGADRKRPTKATETRGHREHLRVFFSVSRCFAMNLWQYAWPLTLKKVMYPAAVEKARSDWSPVQVSIAPGPVRPVY